jgi:hypothetical protein
MILNNKHYFKALLSCLILFSGIVGCQQNQESSLIEEKLTEVAEEKLPETGEVDSRIAELLDSMKMYRFDSVQQAPSFHLTSVAGAAVSLDQYRGKVVLLSFWTTW